MIDEIDAQILTIIQKNARVSNAKIARKIGMAPSAILERIRKLEEKGVIENYEVRLNAKSVNLGLVAFIFIRTSEAYGKMVTALRLAEMPEVQEVHHIAGEDCYLIKVRTKDTESLGRFLREQVTCAPEVLSTRTTIVLETVKETLKLPLVPQK
ncbi:MAG: Lrp/AsnC family transcriptional regulator [Calditrichaeota bacterium]|nr:Lrp/AsnC family transcriptional regulator [Calditrichota bacterium]MCB0297239.1 Lrp/AsnC family transcriptional regulator [Calditrichota bacterium]MCB0303344.1 Lrp/AsnC family transcriptional regulator [Calditrichota bacterium]MCB0315159.1 Lrp/AsnC family transcriptional regulator [Calditrichota bacterium]